MQVRLIISLICISFYLGISSLSMCAQNQTAQDTTQTPQDSADVEPVIIYWSEKNAVGVNLSEVAFVNWNAGGNNSISALFHGQFERNYKKKLTSWKNYLSLRYGLNSQEGQELRKTDDQIQFKTTFGYRKDSVSNWYYSGNIDFRTQFANGYKYPNTDAAISKFMAPGYLLIGVGTQFSHPDENFNAYISPVTEKSTFVLDQRLANEGAFGVDPAEYDELGNLIDEGNKVRSEFGFLVTSDFKKQVFPNVNMNTQISLYSDYLRDFGNIDVDWQLAFDMKVNDFIKANIGSHLLYDNDVKYKEDTNGDGNLETLGARVQWKQLLGVGFTYVF
ncbi:MULTISPECIES: DUF3078 domain-containing protein [Zunongwangia]|nr:DUF3078 domain-containing protein [Zunongwangia profunda]HAJ81578.1 DUF3078 domain-containing protein [Zunongwangia profunda]HCV79921.1 DUF3078 domain-containing protein [Zunongwangia profunda]|tara:strand:+ start:7216 stop:8214 length:999 start_codon:yes stop_codon:yes gene_type:complete